MKKLLILSLSLFSLVESKVNPTTITIENKSVIKDECLALAISDKSGSVIQNIDFSNASKLEDGSLKFSNISTKADQFSITSASKNYSKCTFPFKGDYPSFTTNTELPVQKQRNNAAIVSPWNSDFNPVIDDTILTLNLESKK